MKITCVARDEKLITLYTLGAVVFTSSIVENAFLSIPAQKTNSVPIPVNSDLSLNNALARFGDLDSVSNDAKMLGQSI